MKIVIIGGSIAGMACALRLQKRGHRVSILERRSSAASGGFGMILDGTACQNLRELGVSMSGHTHSIGQYHVYDLNHNFHSRQPLQDCQGIERQRLVSQMRNQLQPGSIQFGAEFDHFIEDQNGSTRAAALRNGKIIEADLFIGADGVRSKIRRDCFPESTLNSVKSVEIVGMTQFERIPSELKGTFKKYLNGREGAAMGMVPTADQKVIWYFQWDLRRWPQTLMEPAARSGWLKTELQRWPSLVRKVVGSKDLRHCHLWRTTDMDLPSRFHKGNVLLVGDAAHPLLTFTSQGVGSALEDGLILGDALSDWDSTSVDSLDRRLTDFANKRIPVLQRRLEEGRSLQRQFLGLESHSIDRVPVCA
ncbi:MAG: FAD-dependent oxidoreductase [Planctomycetota bacterium]